MLPQRPDLSRRSAGVGVAAVWLLLFLMMFGVSCTEHPSDRPSETGRETVQAGKPASPDTGEDITLPSDTTPAYTRPAETETETVPVLSPTVSPAGGLYTSPVLVSADCPDGYTVRYTTDGSVPDASSACFPASLKAAGQVRHADVIRAACFDASGKLEGRVVTHTYVRVEKTETPLYTVMISVDRADLDRMMSRPHEKTERPAHVEIVTPDGQTVISQDAGLRLFGGSSRGLAQKSFKLVARKTGYFGETEAYMGEGKFSYPLFPERLVRGGKNQGQVLDAYDGFVLRNGGNDALLSSACDPLSPVLLRDGVANRFGHRLTPHVDVSLSQFATVYVNGDYYGLLDMRENQNEDYVRRVYGVDAQDVVIVKSELDTSRHCDRHANGGQCRFCNVWFFYETDSDPASQAELRAWKALCEKAASALNAGEETYRQVFDELSACVDLDSLREYFALNMYLCNTDWPHNNVKLWRYTGAPVEGNPITDGKWRFMTRDMDMTMGRYQSQPLPELNTLEQTDTFRWILGDVLPGYADRQTYPDSLGLKGLFAFFLRDDGFRRSFADTCRTLADSASETVLSEEYGRLRRQIADEMPAHIACWSRHLPHGYSVRTWTRATTTVRRFIENRPPLFRNQLETMLEQYR